eukprot:gene4180-7490_t
MFLKKFCKENTKLFSQTTRLYNQNSYQILSNLRRKIPTEEKITEDTTKLKERFLLQLKRKKKRETEIEFPKLKGIKEHLWDNIAGFKHFVAPQVNKEELQQLLDCEYESDTFVLIDVRSFLRAEDFKIPKSVTLPVDDITEDCLSLSEEHFEQRYKFKKPDLTKNIILFSDSSEEAEVAGFILQFYGYPSVTIYRGGVQDWFGSEFKVSVQIKPQYEHKNEEELWKPYEQELKVKDAIEEFEEMFPKAKSLTK